MDEEHHDTACSALEISFSLKDLGAAKMLLFREAETCSRPIEQIKTTRSPQEVRHSRPQTLHSQARAK